MLQYVFATSRFAVATDEPLKPGPQVPFFTPRQFVLGNPMFQSVPAEMVFGGVEVVRTVQGAGSGLGQ
ncbi:unnamed protein product [Gadus morhua 'NCC']